MTAQADAITTLVRSEVAKAADWQLVTVQAVNSDGTCDVTAPDGSTIPAVRRHRDYIAPAVGDVAIMHRSRMNSRYLAGTLSPGTGWQPLTYTSPWADRGGSPGFHVADGAVRLRGNIKSTATVSGGAVIATLPAGARPQVFDYYPTVYNVSSLAPTYLTISPDGTIVYNGASNATVTYLMLGGITIPLY